MGGGEGALSQARPVPRTVEVTACPLCGSSRHDPRFEVPDRLFGVPGRYRYRECAACGTVFQSPRVITEDLPLLYPGSYYTHTPPALDEAARGSAMRGARDAVARRVRAAVRPGEGDPGILGRVLGASRRLRERAFWDRGIDELIPRRSPAGRLLDFGCGTGVHMRLLGTLGWRVEGLEWDAGAAEVARRVTGRPVWVGDVHAFRPEHPFDAILLNHVLEHLPDPLRDLARLRDLLRPGGRVVLVWPNPEGLGARRFGPAWFAWDPPRHLVIPPASAVGAAGTRLGLRVRSWRSLGRGAASHAAYSRAIETGRPVTLDHPDVRPSDRLFHQLERLLLPFARAAGEEAVVVLER
jgi:SAM-dependent methyltransferase